MSWEIGRTDEERSILRTVAHATEVGKMIVPPPNIPAVRVNALRRAFDATVKDPSFIDDLKAARIELDPMTGEELQKLVGAQLTTGAHRQSQVDVPLEN